MKKQIHEAVQREIDITDNSIRPHPKNPRRGNISAIKDSIKTNGYYPTIFIQESTNFIIKGNHTFKALKELFDAGFKEYSNIKINVLNVDDEEALRIILADNASSDYGSYNNESAFELLDELSKTDLGLVGSLWTNDDYENLKFVLNKNPAITADEIDNPNEDEVAERLTAGENTIESIKGEHSIPEENFLVMFPAEADYDIPILDLNMQVEKIELPFMVWSMQRTAKSLARGEVATLGFYCEDVAFEGLWKNPNKIVGQRVRNVVEVNFSTDSQAPKAHGLWQIYRKRWLARYWQSKGLRVMVDVCINRSVWDIGFLGVPKGWRAYCNRGNVFVNDEEAKAHYLDMFKLCQAQAETEDIIYMIYGGGNVIKRLCSENKWLWIPDEKTVIHGKEIDTLRATEEASKSDLTGE